MKICWITDKGVSKIYKFKKTIKNLEGDNMIAEICKWYNNADSPVSLLIDDLTNVWVDVSGNGVVELGEDWGYAKYGENSSMSYLEKSILDEFPQVKVTFFVPVGIREGVIEDPEVKSISKMINCDDETKEFFNSIFLNSKYEIAYHGTTHGKPGKKASDFIQEWQMFKSIDDAVNTINMGKEIYKDVFNCYPKGGKYCGYIANDFSDESINNTGFIWWCRFSNIGLVEYKDCKFGGNDSNPITNFDVKHFGSNNVIDIPTTLNGSYLNAALYPNLKTLKGLIKSILKTTLIRKKLRKVDFLLKNNLVISIQEHIAPSRVDGKRQMPNIFDDQESLKTIFNHLKNHNVWYCTCSELAEYVIARENAQIDVISSNSFNLKNLKKELCENTKLTLLIKDFKANSIILPDGNKLKVINNLVNIPLIDGKYELV